MSQIDLSQLPTPAIIESPTFEAVYAERKAALLALVPENIRDQVAETLQYESEPLAILLQENAYRELLLRTRINEAYAATTISHAAGTDLDHVLALFNMQRLVVQEADPTATPVIEEILESDDAFRQRGLGAFDTLSTAGPANSYIQHARNASGQVADVTAISPQPCEVVVSVLSAAADGVADAALLATVSAAITGEDVRPIGDRVTVQSAAIIDYAIDATLYFFPGPETTPILAAANQSITSYISNQRRLGRDIRRSAIIAALHVAGVQRVVLTAPAVDLVLDATQAGRCTAVNLIPGGSDE